MISNFEKTIYNNHLIAYRKAQNNPFRIKEKFDNLEEDTIITLKKLSKFFSNYPHIKQFDFFIAPYKIYQDDSYHTLEFYTKRKAITLYTQYVKDRELDDPDSKDTLERLMKSLKFIFDFCKEKELTLEKYPLYIEEATPSILNHLKSHNINFYTLHVLTIQKIPVESRILDFMIPNFHQIFQTTRNKFYSSNKMKQLSIKLKEQIQNNKITKLH
jgi:hypothetical protein